MTCPLQLGLPAVLSSIGFLLAPVSVAAAEPDVKGIEFFETKIRPVLVAQCYECHSAKAPKVKGGLLLDTRDGLRRGGDNGPAVSLGKPEESLLIKRLEHTGELKMPPKEKLTERVIGDFVTWVRMGAPDPRESNGTMSYKRLTMEEAKTFWSLVPPAKHASPSVKDAAWPRSEIDKFILARLEQKGLKPASDADRRALIRRVTFDLIGLPPTPEEVEDFVRDTSPSAFEKVVDRLLGSPHFGERWGRYWLDAARYAESNGNADNTPFPHAWRYRDYVIDAFNRDKPYNRFIQEQIAGDLLPSDGPEQKDEYLIATAFLALTSKPRAQNNPDYRYDLIADQIDVTTRPILGMSVMCARCHDHKFDPVSTKEYYALAGIFDSTLMLAGAGQRQQGTGGLHSLSNGGSAMGLREGKPVDSRVLIRGEARQPGETVQRGFLACVPMADPPKVNRSQSGRLELAHWLTRNDNPLTARVASNRIWLHLFGNGLVRSPDNFGALGEKPTHPELLDHLALRFIQDGWSTKKLIRLIVLSRTYQLSSDHNEANFKLDPDNLLLWRMSYRRLDAEALRDAVLATSGRLDPKRPEGTLVGQLPAKPNKPNKPRPNAADSSHRSVYLGFPRGAPINELLTVFDAANPNLSMSQREVTTVPSQALYMMNSPFVAQQSRAFAERIIAGAGTDDGARADLAYRLAFARPASDAEKQRAIAFVQKAQQAFGRDKDATVRGWAALCQALLASAEFRYLD